MGWRLAGSDVSAHASPLNRKVALVGTGAQLGHRLVTNDDLARMVRNYDESSGDFSTWVDWVKHIQVRRFGAVGLVHVG